MDRFERTQSLFAAQYIWWLASIIQFTEVLSYYRHYKTFPSEYVTLESQKKSTQDQDMSDHDLNDVSDNNIVEDQKHTNAKVPNTSITYDNTDTIQPDRIERLREPISFPEIQSNTDQILRETDRFLQRSKKERQRITNKPKRFHKTRSGKIAYRPLSKRKRNRLNAIPTDTLKTYINSRG
jgi:hypothetical protein